MNKKKGEAKQIRKALLLLVKTPYYLGKEIYTLGKFINKKVAEKKVKKRRQSMFSIYENFKILKNIKGNYLNWENKIHNSDSQIGIILGARGTGKTAFGVKFLENIHAKNNKKCYAIGFKETKMPSWINVVENADALGNNAFVLIDEGGILFSSRNSMSNANKFLSELILIARHKNLSILFISQNSSNLDINILRQADFLILKPSSLLQKDFERKIIQKIYEKAEPHFQEFKDDKGITHIYSGEFVGFVSNPLPSFWDEKISKGFR